MNDSPYVWLRGAPWQRLGHVYFRREFRLPAAPRKATIHLFAHTNYHLHVNGQLIGTGPARSYPRFPEYDTYELTPFLRKGANVVAVNVQHVGVATFQSIPVRGGFKAWGEAVCAGGRRVSLSTATGWRAHAARAYDPEPPPFSFAIGPIQIFDARKEPAGWKLPGRPGGRWETPAAVAGALPWGRLRPRSIPHLTQEELLPKQLLGIYPHRQDEAILSFRLMPPCDPAAPAQAREHAFAYSYIHSPRAQRVAVGAYWGEHVLNGRAVPRAPARPEDMAREDIVLGLRKGWNFFFVSYGMAGGVWEMHLAAPRAAGLVFSAERKRDGRIPFRAAGPLPDERAAPILARRPPHGPEDLPELATLWRDRPRLPVAVSPAKGMAWARFEAPLDTQTHQVGAHRIAGGRDTSLVFDMGTVELGRVFVEFDAPRGTVLDVGYAEDLKGERPWHFKNVFVNSGERHIARGGPARLETFARRGLRFLQVSVLNHARPVTIRRVGMVAERYPYPAAGKFECSDPFFNTLWEYGRQTLRNCSEDVITDCPWRERGLYGGDLLPETATAAVVAGDLRLVRRCVEVFLQSASPRTGWLKSRAPAQGDEGSLSDFPMIVLLIAEWYCRLTGDLRFARRCYPVFRRMLARAGSLRDGDGLFRMDRGTFIDWVDMTKKGKTCAYHALLARAFAAWASLLGRLGRRSEAAEAAGLAADIRRRLARFWDGKREAFADSITDAGLEAAWGVASTAWPLCFGRVPARQARPAVAHLRRAMAGLDARTEGKKSAIVTTYGAFYLLGGLYEHGEEAFAEACMRQLYSEMIRRPSGTIWECASTAGTLNHAWSTAPNYYLSTRALGVRLGFPDATDLGQVLIAPQSDTLTWARGAVPHPRGRIEVAWAIRGAHLFLAYRAPVGVKVTVAPVGRLGAMPLSVTAERYRPAGKGTSGLRPREESR